MVGSRKLHSANPKFIISINLHADGHFADQLENIQEYLKFDHEIILNCNNKMYELLRNAEPENVILNPNIIEKRRFHGSLFQGIFENMKLAYHTSEFDYFLVLSARSFFFRKLDLNTIDTFYEDSKCTAAYGCDFIPRTEKHKREWPAMMWKPFSNSDFYSFLQKNKFKYQKGLHPGLLLTHENCELILSFFDQHKDLYESVINTQAPMEEIVIQSILLNWQGFSTLMGVWPGGATPEKMRRKFIISRERKD